MIKTHAAYIVAILVLLLFGHVWLQEHDARIAAENKVKSSEAAVVQLQTQIAAVTTQTAAKVQVVTRVVHDAITPSQVVAAIPQLTDVPLATREVPGNPVDVEVASRPLMELVGEVKTSQIELAGCQQGSALKDQQIVQLQGAVKAAQAKPKFLVRVKRVMEAVAVGVVAGLLLHR